jgi:hemerythrin-like metal-binding protein
MARIDWDDSFSVQHEEIDRQHKKLFDLYNELHETLLHDTVENTTVVRTRTLNNLIEYIDYHFKSEENYLKEINYPDFAKHCQIHNDFSKQVIGYHKDLENGQIIFTTSLIKLIRNWIVDHIMIMDQQYVSYHKK